MNWLIAAASLYVLHKVWSGQQWIESQPTDTVWYSDPYQQDSLGQSGDRSFYVGDLPPGEAPPWRLASETERIAMEQAESGF